MKPHLLLCAMAESSCERPVVTWRPAFLTLIRYSLHISMLNDLQDLRIE